MDENTETELRTQIADLKTQLKRQKKTTNALLLRVKKNLKYQLNANETFEHNSYLLNQIKRTKSQLFHETKTSERFSYIAKHDSLTGLYNRVEFNKALKRIVKSAKNQKRKHALMFLDLDQFKVINDTAGHLAGDEMIEFNPNAIIIKTVADLGPPPSIAKKPPQIKVVKPDVVAPKVGIPKPVADEDVEDEDVVLATKDDLAEILAPDITANDDVIIDIDEDYLPGANEFVPVEIQPEMIYFKKPK